MTPSSRLMEAEMKKRQLRKLQRQKRWTLMTISMKKKRRNDRLEVTLLNFENFGAIDRKKDMLKED